MTAPRRRRVIAFWGNFGTANLGNECTLAAILGNVRAILPAAQILVVCMGAEAAAQEHGVDAIDILPERSENERKGGAPTSRFTQRFLAELGTMRTALRVMKETDTLVMAGTGMLNDYAEGSFGLVYEMCKWTLAARLRGRRVRFVSVGAEHLDRRLSRLFVRTSLRLADVRTFRDEQSRDRARSIGCAVGGDRIFPDLAFSLPKSLLLSPPRPEGAVPTVAVGPYDVRERPSGPDGLSYGEYVERLAAFVVWLVEGRRRVRFILGDTRYDAQVTRDVLVALEARGLRPGDGWLVHEPVATFVDLIGQIAETDAVVASRFHNVTLALLLGKPVLAISYNPKVSALMDSMGLGSYCQEIRELDGERLAAQFLDLEQNAGPLAETIRARASEYRTRLEEQYRMLFSEDPRRA